MITTLGEAILAEVMQRHRVVPRVRPARPDLPEEDGPFPPCCPLGSPDYWTGCGWEAAIPEEDDARPADLSRDFEARLLGKVPRRLEPRRDRWTEQAYRRVADQRAPSEQRIGWWRYWWDYREAKRDAVRAWQIG